MVPCSVDLLRSRKIKDVAPAYKMKYAKATSVVHDIRFVNEGANGTD